jgi:hypothetical protein
MCELQGFRRAPLHAQIGKILQRVVEAVGEVGQANHQGQLYDLSLVVVLAQLLKRSLAYGRSAARDAFRVENRGLLFFIE